MKTASEYQAKKINTILMDKHDLTVEYVKLERKLYEVQ